MARKKELTVGEKVRAAVAKVNEPAATPEITKATEIVRVARQIGGCSKEPLYALLDILTGLPISETAKTVKSVAFAPWMIYRLTEGDNTTLLVGVSLDQEGRYVSLMRLDGSHAGQTNTSQIFPASKKEIEKAIVAMETLGVNKLVKR